MVFTTMAVVSCANIGSPDGGRYDEEPPYVVSATPAQNATNVSKKKANILFNEFIKLENASENVMVSPPQIESANVRADGKRIRITLYDTLQANTTYTVDFGDAIEDNNEGNPMGFYTYSFSTGDHIDTMQVAGKVLQAENLEPVKSILVGLHRLDDKFDDSTFIRKPLIRIARTNGSGAFSIKGVAPGRYRCFALKDGDGDYRYSQLSEMIAFDTTMIVPSQKPDLRYDTCWHDTIHYDSIRVVPYIHYLPDNVVLRAFTCEKQELHLLKTEHLTPDNFGVYFTTKSDSLPRIKGLNFDEKCLSLEKNLTNDTLVYWVTDTTVTHTTDSLNMAITYLDTDTLGELQWRTDTLQMVSRNSWSKIKEDRQKEIDKWEKQRAKQIKRSKTPLPPQQNPFLVQTLAVRVKPTGMLDPNRNVVVEIDEPIRSVDSTRIHLFRMKDSTMIKEPFLFRPTGGKPRSYTLYGEWKPGERYTFVMDSLAMTSVMDKGTQSAKAEFKVHPLDDYGALFIHITRPDSNWTVQLLDASDKVVATQRVEETNTAEFFYLAPNTYYVRCFLDENANGRWDTGDYSKGTQPEPVYYFPKPLVAKAKWDIQQDWDPLSLSLDHQKPDTLTKQKGDAKKTARQLNKERDREKRERMRTGE